MKLICVLLTRLLFFKLFVLCENHEENKVVLEHHRKEMQETSNDTNIERYQENCDKLGTNPYFDMDLVVMEKVWRVYHTWEVPPMPSKCIDVSFVIPTAKTRESVQSHIAPYLINTPNWAAAALYMSMGKSSQDILLFTDNGPAGRFSGVPAGIRDDLFPRSLHKNVILLLQFQFKLLEGGRFLVILDCKSGTAMLLASTKDRIPTNETQAVADALQFGNSGNPSCLEAKPTFMNI